jgi:hypothetical protein
MDLSLSAKDDKKSLLVAGDAHWDKQGSRRKKDSLSSCSIFFNGNMTKLMLGLEPMSQVCIKCAKGAEHDPLVCPINNKGLSKGMEATGSSRLTTNLSKTGKAVVGMHVSDDNSSCQMIMRHSFQDLINAGKMESAA